MQNTFELAVGVCCCCLQICNSVVNMVVMELVLGHYNYFSGDTIPKFLISN